jgi:hypothetical protein
MDVIYYLNIGNFRLKKLPALLGDKVPVTVECVTYFKGFLP